MSLERIEVWDKYETIFSLQESINEFIKDNVSKVVDLRINSVNELAPVNSKSFVDETLGATTVHYAYLRYIPI